MVLEMPDVVESDVTQCDWRAVANLAVDLPLGLRDLSDDMGQVAVVGTPQVDKLEPRAIAIALSVDPEILRVPRKLQVIISLDANKPLVIVCRGVDEVAEDLLR